MSTSILGAMSNKGAPSERFFGEVVSYADDLNSMTVKELASGETRTVKLNDDKIEIAEGQSRPDVASFAGRGKLHTDVGGTVLIEDARKQPDGAWAARWLSAAVRKPDEGAVIEGVMRVGPIKTGSNNKPYRAVDVLEQNATRRIETGGELKDALGASMAGAGAAVIRIAEFDADGNRAIKAMFASAGGDGDTQEQLVANAMERNERLAKLVSVLDTNSLDANVTAIEVVPCKRYFFGSDAGQAARLDTLFTKEGDKGRYSRGFGEGLLVLRKDPEDGYQFAVKAMPKSYQTEFTRGGPFATEGGKAIEAKVVAGWKDSRSASQPQQNDAASAAADATETDFDLSSPPAAAQRSPAPAV